MDLRVDPNIQLINFNSNINDRTNQLSTNKLFETNKEGNIDGNKKEDDNFLSKIQADYQDPETLALLDKNKHLLLYKEIKAKRVKKIKSKNYRRLKKKQKSEEEAKQLALRLSGDKDAIIEELEKLERKRAEERASLKHRSDNKYAKLIKKYNDKKTDQQVQTSLASKRREVIRKLNEMKDVLVDQEIESSFEENEEEVDEENYELEEEEIEDDINDIVCEKQIFENKNEQLNKTINNPKQINMNQEFENILGNNDNPNIFKSSANNEKPKINENRDLESIDLSKIKSKYGTSLDIKLKKEDIKLFDDENDEDFIRIDQNPNENYQIFQEEKDNLIAENVTVANPPKRGWGAWTSNSEYHKEKERELQRQAEIELKNKISQIKSNRIDAKLKNVIISEHRPKTLKTYLVKNVPHEFANKEQYNYVVSQPLGSEKAGQRVFRENVKSKLLTEVGKAILPIDKKHLPRTKYI